MSARRVLAIDPSLTSSGWALFDYPKPVLLGVGIIRSCDAKTSTARRLAEIQLRVGELFDGLNLSGNDVLICEAQTTMRDPRAAILVEQVRGIFETLARSREVTVPGRINPRTVHCEVLGLRGKQLRREVVKALAVRTVSRLYTEALERLQFPTQIETLSRHQDIVDAILLGELAVSKLTSADRAGIAFDEFFDDRVRRSSVSYAKRAKVA